MQKRELADLKHTASSFLKYGAVEKKENRLVHRM